MHAMVGRIVRRLVGRYGRHDTYYLTTARPETSPSLFRRQEASRHRGTLQTQGQVPVVQGLSLASLWVSPKSPPNNCPGLRYNPSSGYNLVNIVYTAELLSIIRCGLYSQVLHGKPCPSAAQPNASSLATSSTNNATQLLASFEWLTSIVRKSPVSIIVGCAIQHPAYYHNET